MKKYKKTLLLSVVCIFVLTFASFFFYISDYYPADEVAISAMNRAPARVEDNLTIFEPDTAGDTGLIFYPGGKVEHTAYWPLLEQLRENGITCVLVEMPFNLAVFDANAADGVFELLPDIKNWYIGGHSLGGAMASSYASKHKERIHGLVLLGSYIYGDYPPADALTIYGSMDMVLDKSKITYSENIVEIKDGNHAQFGNYGFQKGDGTAKITSEEQQLQAVDAILNFIGKQKGQL